MDFPLNPSKGKIGLYSEVKLSDRLNDTVTIGWVPQWQNIYTKIKNDTAYSFVPLSPVLSPRGVPITAIGIEQFVVIRILPDSSYTFFMGKYFKQINQKSGNAVINYEQFTGYVLLNDFKGGNC